MNEKEIKICGYDAIYTEIGNESNTVMCLIKTSNGNVHWYKSVDQTDHKPTNQITKIIGHVKGNETKDFLKEKHIMVTLKEAMDWVEKRLPEKTKPKNEQPIEEDKKQPQETAQEPQEPNKEEIKEEHKQEKVPEDTGTQKIEDKKNIRNPDGTIKKGHSLNPAGRPKGAKNKFLTETLLTELGREYGRVKRPDGTTEIVTQFQQMIREAIRGAIKGDVRYYNSIFDRVEGKPKEDLTINRPEHRDLGDDERDELDEMLGLKK
jgi:outer membrane biosynthesis protein TonB